MESAKITDDSMRVNSLLYYDARSSTQIARPGSSSSHVDAPIQLISPNGSTFLGLPLQDSTTVPRSTARIQDNYLVLSNDITDNEEESGESIRVSELFFTAVQLLCIVSTCLLFFYADIFDPSKSENMSYAQDSPNAFSRIRTNRSSSENALFAVNITTQCFGIISVNFAKGTGLTIFCLAVVATAFFGVTSTPYFLYFFRWCLDLISIYIALVIRSNRIINFAVLHVRRR